MARDSKISVHVSSWLVQLTSDELYKLNRHDPDFIGEDPSQLVVEHYYVQAEDCQGYRWVHDYRFGQDEDKAERFCKKIEGYLEHDGNHLNLDHWNEIDPCYGSDAYCKVHGF